MQIGRTVVKQATNYGALAIVLCALSGCVEHRVAVSPPLSANPPPKGGDQATTTMITGSHFQNEPDHPKTFTSPLPLDVPVSVYRRDSDGSIARGELRVTTALPWWQRFPADFFVDLYPATASVDAVDMATLSPVEPVDRELLLQQAQRDGYARTAAPMKSKP